MILENSEVAFQPDKVLQVKDDERHKARPLIIKPPIIEESNLA